MLFFIQGKLKSSVGISADFPIFLFMDDLSPFNRPRWEEFRFPHFLHRLFNCSDQVLQIVISMRSRKKSSRAFPDIHSLVEKVIVKEFGELYSARKSKTKERTEVRRSHRRGLLCKITVEIFSQEVRSLIQALLQSRPSAFYLLEHGAGRGHGQRMFTEGSGENGFPNTRVRIVAILPEA